MLEEERSRQLVELVAMGAGGTLFLTTYDELRPTTTSASPR